MPKELGSLYFVFLTITLYISWDQFIIVQLTLPSPSNWVPSKFMLVFKRLYLNLLKIVTLLTSKIVLSDYPRDSKQFRLSSNKFLSKSTLKERRILLFQLSVTYHNRIYLSLFISALFMSLLLG